MAFKTMILVVAISLLTGCQTASPPVKSLEVAHQGAYSIQLNHAGTAAMVGSLYHGGSYWTLSSGSAKSSERQFDWNHKADTLTNITSSAFTPDDDFVATSDGRTIVLWNTATGEAGWFWNAPGTIQDMALTSGGRWAVLGMDDYTATVFDIRNGGIRHRLSHDGIVYDVSINNAGLLAATASGDLTAAVWNLNDGSRRYEFKHKNQVKTAELSPSGRLLFTSALSEPGRLWDLNTGKLLREFTNGRGHFSAVRFSDNEQQILTGSTSGLIQLWNTRSGEEMSRWRTTDRAQWLGGNVMVEDVAFAGSLYLASGADGQIYYYER
ncbi:MAG: PQQ-binding-like beta-propeller repeat protein [Oleibacter sp.]|nr:PQQ-binding-like beta-propeller repeat protein [Thalassolituus sp.]